MRRLLQGFLLLVLFLTACNSRQDKQSALVPATGFTLTTPNAIVNLQETRVVLIILKETAPTDEIASLHVRAKNPQQKVIWQGEATLYTDYAIPYWVVYPEFDTVGTWILESTLTTRDGKNAILNLFVTVQSSANSIIAGMPAPQSETLTSATRPLMQLTTDITPDERLYQQTIAQAVTSGKPSLVIFASPGLCSNLLCAPVLDSAIKPLAEKYEGKINVVHVEIYDLLTSEFIPAMAEWGLFNEPWTYLIDAEGIVTARYFGAVSVRELSPVLDSLLNS